MQVGNIDLKERKHLSLTAPTRDLINISPKPLSHGPQGHYTDPAETLISVGLTEDEQWNFEC